MAFFVWAAFMALGVFQVAMGWVGAEEYFGWFAGIAVAALAILFRFTLPATVFCFLGCMEVLKWHWFPSLVISAPGLLFMVPAIGAGVLDWLKSKLLTDHRG